MRHALLALVIAACAAGAPSGADPADGVLDGLTPPQLDSAREILLRLVGPDETRQVLSRNDLLSDLGTGAASVLDRLIAGRLVTVRQARPGRAGEDSDITPDDDAEIELIHESLTRVWRRLRRWIDESHDERSFLADAQSAAELWQRRGRRDDEVWTGPALEDALRRSKRVALLASPVQAFLDAGRRLHGARVRRRRLLIAAGFVALAILAMVLGYMNRRTALQRDLAEAGKAASQLEGARSATMRGDLLEARAKLRGALELRDSPTARALWWDLDRRQLAWRRELGQAPYDVAFSPDGKTIAVARNDNSVQLFDAVTGRASTSRDIDDHQLAARFTPDGGTLITGTYQGILALWDLESGSVQ